MLENVLIVVIVALIVSAIVWYLLRARRRGEKCVGCPYAKQCSRKCGSCAEQTAQNPSDKVR